MIGRQKSGTMQKIQSHDGSRASPACSHIPDMTHQRVLLTMQRELAEQAGKEQDKTVQKQVPSGHDKAQEADSLQMLTALLYFAAGRMQALHIEIGEPTLSRASSSKAEAMPAHLAGFRLVHGQASKVLRHTITVVIIGQ